MLPRHNFSSYRNDMNQSYLHRPKYTSDKKFVQHDQIFMNKPFISIQKFSHKFVKITILTIKVFHFLRGNNQMVQCK